MTQRIVGSNALCVNVCMQIAVLAGGLGTRLGPLTAQTPKSLVPVHGRPFLDYQLRLFKASGFDEVVLLVGHLGGQVRAFAGDGSRYGLRLYYADEGEQLLGTAGAVRQAEPLLAAEFFLTYGDSYLPIDYHAVLAHFHRRDNLALMVVLQNDDRLAPSNVCVRDGYVTAYDKERRAPGLRWINFGVSLLHRDALAAIPPARPSSQEDWYQNLIARRELLAFETNKRFYEVGSPTGLAEFAALAHEAQPP